MGIAKNLLSIKKRINKAANRAGRDPQTIRLVIAGKYADIPTLNIAIDVGVKIIGENKAQDLVKKYQEIGDRVDWHFIGHLQTNKIKYVAPIVTLIHSLDSEKLALELEKYLSKINKNLSVLIEVNTSSESSKSGVSVDDLDLLVSTVKSLPHLKLIGLMTMGADVDNPEDNRQNFKLLKQLADKLKLSELSMGTTRDFEIAIEEGATMVRIGSAIFK